MTSTHTHTHTHTQTTHKQTHTYTKPDVCDPLNWVWCLGMWTTLSSSSIIQHPAQLHTLTHIWYTHTDTHTHTLLCFLNLYHHSCFMWAASSAAKSNFLLWMMWRICIWLSFSSCGSFTRTRGRAAGGRWKLQLMSIYRNLKQELRVWRDEKSGRDSSWTVSGF